MKGFTILIVEDDEMIGELLKKILEREGYHTIWKQDGREAQDTAKHADLVILDIMLPGEDGFLVANKIKKLDIPILFLSALQDIDSRLEGLAIGEDYMIKPFDPRELLVRMKKMLEQKYGMFKQIKHLSIDAEHRRVFRGSLQQEVGFTAIERKIFFYLYENRNRILSKEHFFSFLWPLEDRNDNILNVHLRNVRLKIDDRNGDIIQNVYGEGYRMNTYMKK